MSLINRSYVSTTNVLSPGGLSLKTVLLFFPVSICKPDLGLVVDTTRSLRDENIPVLKEALADLVQKFPISEDKTHVSLETFYRITTVHNKFNDPTYWSVSAVIDLINTSFYKLRSPTYIDRALETANDTMFTVEDGDRPGDMNSLVVFTDGRTNDKSDLHLLSNSVQALKVTIIQLDWFSKATQNDMNRMLKWK